MTRWPRPLTCRAAQGRGDPQRGEVGRSDARPRGAREDGTVPIGPPDESLGRTELGVRPAPAVDELHGRPPPTLLVIEKAGPGSHEPVVAGAVAVDGVLPVGGDRTGDDPGIESTEGVMVDAEPRRRPKREAVDDDIGCPCELVELLPSLGAVQIEAGTSLAPIPDPVAGLVRKWIARWRLDPYDVGTVVGQEHGGHRSRHAPGQVEDAQILRILQPYDSTLHIPVGPP